MFVVFLDRFPGNLPRVRVVVVEIRHHFGSNPQDPPVVSPFASVQQNRDQQQDRNARAVLEIWIAHAGIKKYTPVLFHPFAVVQVVRIELLEQELVPGVGTLIQWLRGRWTGLNRPLLRTQMLLGNGVAGKQKQRRYDRNTKDTPMATSILIIGIIRI